MDLCGRFLAIWLEEDRLWQKNEDQLLKDLAVVTKENDFGKEFFC